MSLSPRTGRRAPVYQIDFTAVAAGKRIASTKRRVRWRFGFANPDALASGETGTACRGEEHDITIVWSLTSGKRMILADGQEVHYSNSRNNLFEYSWTMKGNHVLKVVAHASPPLSPTPGFRQYDFFVNGQSFFSFPKVFRLGLAPNDPRARSPGTAQMAEASHRYTPGTVGRRTGSANGIVSLEAPGNEDEEEAYLQEAIRQSLENDAKKAAAAAEGAPAPASNDLLDFGSPTPTQAAPGAIVPAASNDPFGFASAGAPPAQPNPYGGALVAAPPSSGYGGYTAAPNPYGAPPPGSNPYAPAGPTAQNPYGAQPAPANPYGEAPKDNPYAPAAPDSNPYGGPSSSNPYGAPAPANPYGATASSNPYAAGTPAPTNPYTAGTPSVASNPYGTAPAPTNTFPGAPAPPAAAGASTASNPYGAPASSYGQPNTTPQPTTANGFPPNEQQTPTPADNFFAVPGPTPPAPVGTPVPTSTNPYGAMNGGGNAPPSSVTPRGQQTPSTLGFGSPPAELSNFTPGPSMVSEVPNGATETPNGGGSKVDQAYAKLASMDSFTLVSKKDDEKSNPFETMSIGGTKSLADMKKEKPKQPKEVMKSHAVVVSSNQNGYASQYGVQQPFAGGMQPQQQMGGAPMPQQQQFGAPMQQQQQLGGQPQQQFGGQPQQQPAAFQQQQQQQQQSAPSMQQQPFGQQPAYGQPQFAQQPAAAMQQQPQFSSQYGQQGAPQQPQQYGQPFGAQQGYY